MAKAAKKIETTIEITPITMGRITCHIVGKTPLYMHRFSKKAREQLLFPKGRINSAEKAENLKHDPLNEYRECMYLNRDNSQPSAIHIPAGSFSKAIAAAALDMPGASRSQILRLVSIASTQINLFGTPRLVMDMVRSSDMAKTPDVRTRAIFPEWACSIEVEYVSTLLKEGQIVNLLAAAGMIVGIGDWRPQKGGSHGKFQIVDQNDADYKRIIKQGAKAAQLEAYQNPVAYDADTEELFTWFNAEAARREKAVPSNVAAKADRAVARATKGKRKSGNGAEAH